MGRLGERGSAIGEVGFGPLSDGKPSRARRMSKLCAWLMLIFGGLGFLVGLVVPSLRCWSSAC